MDTKRLQQMLDEGRDVYIPGESSPEVRLVVNNGQVDIKINN